MRITDYPATIDNTFPLLFDEEDEDTMPVFDDTYWLDTEKTVDDGAVCVHFSWHMHVQGFQDKQTGVYTIYYTMQNTKDDFHEYYTDFEISDADSVACLTRIVSANGSLDTGTLCKIIDSFYYSLGAKGPDVWSRNEFKALCKIISEQNK